MNCIIFENDDFCNETGELNHEGLFLCPDHSLARQMANKKTKALSAVKSAEKTGIYFLRIPYQTVKVGATVDLYKRLTKLHNDFKLGRDQRIELLAWDPDCRYYHEALYHTKFWDFLLTDREGEQFKECPEILAEAEAIGIAQNNDYSRYLNQYRPTGNAQHKQLYLPPSMR